MKLRRPMLVAALVAGLALPGFALLGGSAQAGTDGSLTLSPASGTDQTPLELDTSGPCSDASATNIRGYIDGSGLSSVSIVGNQPFAGLPTTSSGGYKIAVANNFHDIAASAGATLSGQYTLTVECRQQFGGSLGTFTGTVTFSNPQTYAFDGISTATALSASPASPQLVGTDVTFTATVTPSAATGSVQLKDGTVNLGSPIPVSGGTAHLTTHALNQGDHSITAVFTGSGGYGASTSAVTPFTVTSPSNPSPTTTTTVLSVAPVSPRQVGEPVTVSASVSPSAAGTIQFHDGSANLGAPVTLTGGSASVTSSTLATGDHSFTAAFIPADPAAFSASSSAAVGYVITPSKPVLMVGPAVSGHPAVDSSVSCVGFTFSSATSIAYGWFRDGAAIAGATGETYLLQAADANTQLTCKVTATNSAGSISATSPAVTVAAGAAIVKVKGPKLSGFSGTKAKKGKKLTVKAGTWSFLGVKVAIQWTRDTKAIKGATKSTYVPTSKDVGHKVACVLKATLLGHAQGKAVTGSVRITR